MGCRIYRHVGIRGMHSWDVRLNRRGKSVEATSKFIRFVYFWVHILLGYRYFAIHYSLFRYLMRSKAKMSRTVTHCHAVRYILRTLLARKTCLRDLHFPMIQGTKQNKLSKEATLTIQRYFLVSL